MKTFFVSAVALTSLYSLNASAIDEILPCNGCDEQTMELTAQVQSIAVAENEYGVETSSIVDGDTHSVFKSPKYPEGSLYRLATSSEVKLYFADGSFYSIYPTLLKYSQKSVTGEFVDGSLREQNRPVWELSADNQLLYDEYKLFSEAINQQIAMDSQRNLSTDDASSILESDELAGKTRTSPFTIIKKKVTSLPARY